MLKSRKGQEGFTLIELLVVVLIIGILAAIAIPAFLGQKKGAQDSNSKSLLRNAAISMESYYSENQDFDAPGAAIGTIAAPADFAAIEPNVNWAVGAVPAIGDASTLAKDDNVHVVLTQTNGAGSSYDAYSLWSTSASGNGFTYERDINAQTEKCKGDQAFDAGCGTNEW